MTELRITPRPGFTMTVDRRWAQELFEDMKRSGISDLRSTPTTDALYLALLKALKPEEKTRVPALSWGPGKWRRTSSGDYVWTQKVYENGGRTIRRGLVLAMVERLESGLWKPWVYPYGDDSLPGKPAEVVDRRPTKTLWEAKDVAMDEFLLQRRAIEQG